MCVYREGKRIVIVGAKQEHAVHPSKVPRGSQPRIYTEESTNTVVGRLIGATIDTNISAPAA